MSGPAWLADLLACVMIVVAGYSAGRLIVARVSSEPTHADVDATHVVMGAAMSGMLVPDLNFAPSQLWEVVFIAVAGWFAARIFLIGGRAAVPDRHADPIHCVPHYATHVVMALAMVYMYVAPPTGPAMSGMVMSPAGGIFPNSVGVTLIFLLALAASGSWEVTIAARFRRRRPVSVSAAAAVRVGAGSAAVPDFDPAEAAEVVTDYAGRALPGGWLSPGIESACHVAMCVTMAYMLVELL
jgi:hypothetical protein